MYYMIKKKSKPTITRQMSYKNTYSLKTVLLKDKNSNTSKVNLY